MPLRGTGDLLAFLSSSAACTAGDVFHVLNRAVARLTIFEKPEDYAAFMRVLDET